MLCNRNLLCIHSKVKTSAKRSRQTLLWMHGKPSCPISKHPMHKTFWGRKFYRGVEKPPPWFVLMLSMLWKPDPQDYIQHLKIPGGKTAKLKALKRSWMKDWRRIMGRWWGSSSCCGHSVRTNQGWRHLQGRHRWKVPPANAFYWSIQACRLRMLMYYYS